VHIQVYLCLDDNHSIPRHTGTAAFNSNNVHNTIIISGVAKGVPLPMSPRRSWKVFSKCTIFAVLNFCVFCLVEYSALCIRLLGPSPQTPPGLCPRTPLGGAGGPPDPLFCPPLSKFLATPLIIISIIICPKTA